MQVSCTLAVTLLLSMAAAAHVPTNHDVAGKMSTVEQSSNRSHPSQVASEPVVNPTEKATNDDLGAALSNRNKRRLQQRRQKRIQQRKGPYSRQSEGTTSTPVEVSPAAMDRQEGSDTPGSPQGSSRRHHQVEESAPSSADGHDHLNMKLEYPGRVSLHGTVFGIEAALRAASESGATKATFSPAGRRPQANSRIQQAEHANLPLTLQRPGLPPLQLKVDNIQQAGYFANLSARAFNLGQHRREGVQGRLDAIKETDSSGSSTSSSESD